MDVTFNQPVREFLSYLRIECGLAANTIESYALDLKRLCRFLAEQNILHPADLDGRHFIDYLRSLREDELTGKTVARHLATLRAFARFLVFHQYCEIDPSEMLERPATWQRVPQVMQMKHIRALLESPQPSDRMYLRDKAVLELMYATGCRASEVGAIHVSDFHDDIGVIKITGKGGRQRIVPIGKPALEAIQQYYRELRGNLIHDDANCEYLFLTLRGTRMDRFVIWAMIKKLAKRAGLTNVHPHVIRHTFATHLLGGGADLRVVQELLGHARVTTTQIYTHVDQGRLKKVIDSFHPRP